MVSLLAAVQPLDEPSVLARVFDGQPWLISGVILLAGFAGYLVLNSQRQPRRARAAALGAVLVAVGLNVAARLIVTERERVAQATLELVRATATVDMAKLEEMLAPDCMAITAGVFPAVPIVPDGTSRTLLLAAVQSQLGGPYKLSEYGVLETQVQINGPTAARTQVRVRATAESLGVPGISWWRLDWRKSGGGEWKVVLIELLEMDGVRGFLGG
jgi:hypothetical protein